MSRNFRLGEGAYSQLQIQVYEAIRNQDVVDLSAIETNVDRFTSTRKELSARQDAGAIRVRRLNTARCIFFAAGPFTIQEIRTRAAELGVPFTSVGARSWSVCLSSQSGSDAGCGGHAHGDPGAHFCSTSSRPSQPWR